MSSMNWKRIIAGGLVTGLVLNLGEFAVEPLMGQQMEDFFRRLGLPVPGEDAMLTLGVAAFLLGIIAVWLYAAIRPRYGAGIVTAVIAGVAVWALSCLLPNIAMYAFGVFDARPFWFSTVWPLVETVVATIAGAFVYRENPAPVPAASRA